MWRRWTTIAVFFGLLGCSPQPSAPPNQKVQITAPGVNVDVDKKKGNVEVEAPGVKINVNPK